LIVIKPSFKVMEPTRSVLDLYKKIELCGRNAYKSEGNITSTSYIDFISKILKRKHYSVLEHGYLTVSYPVGLEVWNSYAAEFRDDYLFFVQTNSDKVYITANVRAWMEKIQYSDSEFCDLAKQLFNKEVPLIFNYPSRSNLINNLLSLDWNIVAAATVRIIADRGFLAEITRHRHASFTVESTRYCNYSKDSFGKELTFIEPFDLKDENRQTWEYAMASAEHHYFNLIDNGVSPQWARTVLPMSLKTDIVMSAFNHEWYTIFCLRCAESAHPQMREIMEPLSDYYDFED